MKTKVKLSLVMGFLLLIGYNSYSEKINHLKKEEKMDTRESTQKNKEKVRNLYENILSSGDLEQLYDLFDDDYTGIFGEKGAAGFEATVRSIISAFPDTKWSVEEIIAEGDKVVLRWIRTGKHTGTFRGFKPSYVDITDHGIVIYQFKNSKIINSWLLTDRLGLLQQIGVIPQDLNELQPEQN